MLVSRIVLSRNKVFQRSLLHSYKEKTIDTNEKTVKINEWNINYLKIGSGPHHVLCIPGTLGSIWTDFRLQIEGFDRNEFTLVVWDPPGYGKSRPPLRVFKTDMYDTDADYAYELMQALQIPKYSILGWSGGGISALIHAAKHPETMQKLVVWGSPSYLHPHELDFFRNLRDIDKWSDQMKQPLIEVYGQELLSSYWSKWVDTAIDLCNNKQGNFCSHLLKHIICPTFVLVGEKDAVADPVHAYHLERNVADSRLHVYPEGRHNLHINYAYDFNCRVQDFLKQPLTRTKPRTK